ncbi:MAG: class I SAM-dependent methyltransferase [Nitrospirota bacterium]|nr:class I SAM-dependent methyltransferase [Nitrospirota bacterium]
MNHPAPTFADIYDAVVGDDYQEYWWRGFERFVADHQVEFSTVCDVACGTGRTALRLAEQGKQVTGTDLSADMIRVARAHCELAGIQVDFTVQPMQELSLPEPVDLIVCAYDALNALPSEDLLRRTLGGFSAHLNPGGHVVCDMATIRHLCEDWGSDEIRTDDPYPSVWHSVWDDDRGMLSLHLTVAVPTGGGICRVTERVCEYGYSQALIEDAIAAAGLVIQDRRDLIPWTPGSDQGDRWFYLLQKPQGVTLP